MSIELVPFNPVWTKKFAQFKQALLVAAPKFFKDIIHIGSTSITNMMAKDIIDVQCAVESFELLPEMEKIFKPLGLSLVPSFTQDHVPFQDNILCSNSWEKRFFTGVFNSQRYNVHIRIHHSLNWQFAIRFRDHLIEDKQVHFAYLQCKQRLAEAKVSLKDYCSIKDTFIDLISLGFPKEH